MFVGCASSAAPPSRPAVTTLTAPTFAPSPALPPVYGVEEALSDALASPLTLVGIGGFPGYYRHLSCVHRNAHVFVADLRCNDPETYQFEAIIYSPARGRVEITADARQKKAAVSTLSRADYEVFAASGAGSWAGPPQLTLGMSYDEITTYEEQRTQRQIECPSHGPMPPKCVRTFSPDAFALANRDFLASPPHDWYQFERTLVSARHANYAAADVTTLTPNQLAAWGAAIAFKHGIDVAENAMPFVGRRDRFAPVVAVADGMAYVGARRAAAVVVARADRAGATKWESVLTEPGIREESDTSLVATVDGFVVHAMGYIDPRLKALHRLVKIDERGKVRWKWHPPDHGPIAIPQFFRAGLTPRGTVVIDGYVQTVRDGPVLGWTAEVSAEGKTLREEVGSTELGKKNSLP